MLESDYYSKHYLIPEIGKEGQEKLKKAKVLVIGAGGLGSPLLHYLTATGVGTLGIVDGDTVSLSNLQRQILYNTKDIGLPKAVVAKEKLSLVNPFVSFMVYPYFLTPSNALNLFKEYDLIVDATDNFSTRYLINDAAIICNKPIVYGAVESFEGQVAVFNFKYSGTYRCVFPQPPHNAPKDFGVLGVLPGIIGSLQAFEVIKIICGMKGILTHQILTFNLLTATTRIIKYKKTSRSQIETLQESY